MTDWQSLAERAVARCHALAAHSETAGALTRTYLSPPMRGVHRELGGWMESAGMEVRVDAAGNLVGRKAAADPGAPIFLVGSHLDTVRNAGRFDGILGVVAGVEVAGATGALPFHLDVVGFSEEEGVRFGATYFGSRAIAGSFDPAWLELRDATGITLSQAILDFGLDPGAIPAAAYDPERLLGYLELHIEQGPVLEAIAAPVGVAEAIVGQSRLRLRLGGRAGHAGTTPMGMRNDALTGAAEFVLEVERCGRAREGLVATVGRLEVAPGSSNAIPGEVTFSLDVRHKSDDERRRAVAGLLEQGRAVADERGLRFAYRTLLDEPTAWMDRGFSGQLGRSRGLPVLVSGAGHDAAVLAGFTRVALLFVRSPEGLSHHPDERVESGDVAVALEAMADFLRDLEVAPRAV